jgi:hypothetical protein
MSFKLSLRLLPIRLIGITNSTFPNVVHILFVLGYKDITIILFFQIYIVKILLKDFNDWDDHESGYCLAHPNTCQTKS